MSRVPESAHRDLRNRLNFLGGAAGYVAVVVLAFWTRTALVSTLDKDYVALNAILLNLVSVVSIAEAGIVTAAMFRLYGPLSRGDRRAVAAWLRASRFYYRCAMLGIAGLGLAITCIVPWIVEDLDLDPTIVIGLFWLAIGHALGLCVFATDKVLLLADQRNYLVVISQAGALLVQSALQVFALVQTQSFALFMFIQVLGTLLWSAGAAILSRRRYPRAYFMGKMTPAERKALGADIWHLLPYKVGAVGLSATDAILMSVLVRATLAGVVSNYSLIVNSMNGVLMQGFNGIAAAIGTHNVESDPERRTTVFYQMTMLSVWLFGTVGVCLAVLLNPFIELWLGGSYLLGEWEVLALVGAFYVTGTNQVPSLYRSSLGIFRRTKYVPILALVLNVILSVILANVWGLLGVFVATIASRGLTFSLVDPILVSRSSLATGSGTFFVRTARGALGVSLVWLLTTLVADRVAIDGYLGFAFLVPVAVLVSGGALATWLCLDRDFRGLLGRLRSHAS